MSRFTEAWGALTGRVSAGSVVPQESGVVAELARMRESSDALTSLIEEDREWQRIGSLDPASELSPRQIDVELQLAQHFAENSPIARKLIDSLASHVVGGAITYDSDNAQLDKLLSQFWTDPTNEMDSYLPKLCREWLVYGELFLPVFVSEQQGLMRLGYLHPRNIKTVRFDPDNSRVALSVTESRHGLDDRTWTVIGPETTAEQVAEGQNMLLYYPYQWRAAGRGRPVLAPAFYWIQKAERWLSERMMRATFANAWSWDLTLKNATGEMVREQSSALEAGGMPHGGTYVHNDAAELKAVSPTLGASDAIDDFHALLKYIGHTASLPSHWIGAEADVNRTTAESSSSPTIKFLEGLQAEFGARIMHMLTLQRDLFVAAGVWRPSGKDVGNITLTLSDLTPQNNDLLGNAVAKLVPATIAAVHSGLMDMTTARRLIYQVSDMPMPDNIEELVEEQKRDDAIMAAYFLSQQGGQNKPEEDASKPEDAEETE